jgi:hypothetical protein
MKLSDTDRTGPALDRLGDKKVGRFWGVPRLNRSRGKPVFVSCVGLRISAKPTAATTRLAATGPCERANHIKTIPIPATARSTKTGRGELASPTLLRMPRGQYSL